MTLPPASVSSGSGGPSSLFPGTDGCAHVLCGCPGRYKQGGNVFVYLDSAVGAQDFWKNRKVYLRVSAPLHLSDLPLSLTLPFPLSLLLNLVKGQDVFLLLAGRLAVPAL